MPKTTKNAKVEKLEKDLAASNLVDSPESLEILIQKVQKAQRIFSTFSQEKVNAIFKAAATAADKARIPLARMAIEETGMGVLEDKIIKNHFASEYIYNKHKNAKTCGVIREDKINGIKVVAEPLGIIAGIVEILLLVMANLLDKQNPIKGKNKSDFMRLAKTIPGEILSLFKKMMCTMKFEFVQRREYFMRKGTEYGLDVLSILWPDALR